MGNDKLGFVSGTYLDSQGNRHLVDTPETQQAYQNWSTSKTEEVQNSSLDELAKKYNIANINTPEGKTQLLNKMIFLDASTRNNITSILNQKIPTNQATVQQQDNTTNTTTNKDQTDNSETVAIGNEIANEDTASLFANPDIKDYQLAEVYCVGKTADCSQNFKRTDFISLLPQDQQKAAVQNQKDNLQKKTDQNKEIYSKYVSTGVSDQTLAQEYCSNYNTRGYASEIQCTKDFQREDYLATSSLTDTEKSKAQGVYEENLTNEIMKTNADYDTKVVLMQIVTKFQNSSISDTTLAQEYCNDYSAWGYNSKQVCTTNFKRSDYLSIADQLQRNLSGNPVSAKSTSTQSTNKIATEIKTINNFCFDILNVDCVNGCIPDTSGGKCKTTSPITPTAPKTINTNLTNCAKATDGYCYDKNGNEIVYYGQGDPRWGQVQLPGSSDGNVQANTYAASACGQTTLAMILASYTDPGITPMDVVKQYYPWSSYKGTGFSIVSDVLTEKGYDVERLNVSTQKLKEYIKNGWLGFTSITFKDRNNNTHSHFTLIVDLNDKGDFVYNDPYFGENTTLKDKGINYTINDITLIQPPKK